VERLNEGLLAGRRLALVSAPAGFGKTTLVAEWAASLASVWEWLRAAERPCAWLSLDEGDNDPARFLTYLVAALQGVDSNIGRSAQAMLQTPQPASPEAILTSLINDISATPNPFVLVLDDYHLIRTLPIHQQLTFLLEHQPSQMHLVIASREDPPLPLPRLRARAQMVELRQADLTFTAEETAAFLRQTMGLELSRGDVAALQRRIEGWVAGLQLVGLSLRGRDDVEKLIGSFTGSHRYVLDYLIEEVFESQTDEVQDFLLKTSILDRFTASLCDAVCFGVTGTAAGPRSSREVLLALDQANLFVVPLDESRRWYRFHRLFADLLRQQLRRSEMGALVPELHRRASRWYDAEGFPSDAVKHALAASDWGRAAALILEVEDEMLKRGEVVTLLGWLRALPDETLRSHPQLYLSYGWALILTGQLDAAGSTLAEAERVAQGQAGGDGPEAFLGNIVSAQAFMARVRGNDVRTIELSQRALSLLPPDDPESRCILAVNLGMAHWSQGHLTEAGQALMEAEQAAQRSGNHYARLTALAFLGVVHAAKGRLHEGAEWLREAIRAGRGSPPTALAYDTLSALLYEWNDLDGAAEHLEQGIELGARSGNVEIQIGGYRHLARLRQAQGDPSAALDALQQAHHLAREKDVSPLMRARNAACHVRIALAQGDLATAILWAEHVAVDADGSAFYPLLGLTLARLLLAQNEKAAAAQQLEAWYEAAVRAGWQFGVIEVRALQALAAPTADQALTFLADALALAEPEGYVRTFVDKGEPIAKLLRQAAARGTEPAYARRLLGGFSRPPAPSRPTEQRLTEPLSERELDVLQILAKHKTNQEIAQTLVISVNTVKTHLKNIYGKLGVHNRQEAVAEARELNLLA
jgi:LuxR family maltose regulon positive regulatory protein